MISPPPRALRIQPPVEMLLKAFRDVEFLLGAQLVLFRHISSPIVVSVPPGIDVVDPPKGAIVLGAAAGKPQRLVVFGVVAPLVANLANLPAVVNFLDQTPALFDVEAHGLL